MKRKFSSALSSALFFKASLKLPAIALVSATILLSACSHSSITNALANKDVSTQPTASANWNDTVKKVSSGIVSIQTDVPVSFDGKWNSSGYATGFVVDAKRGIILTNRHVVSPGPITAKAILNNNEEIELTPLYIDPIHDFGFFSYKPEQIKYLKPYQFSLNPNSAHVGQAIRIIGNDAGQKLSILDGTISRLDREAPNYGRGSYNDFNTYYIQAATASTGGSSGSPVINIKGEVVALNAGSQSKSANAFFFPLDDIKRALSLLQQGKKIARGTLKTTFKPLSYSELQRLGVDAKTEAQFRKNYPNIKGLFSVNAIVPNSSADEVLAVGDVLLSLNNLPIVDFNTLNQQLNNHVNENLDISVLRRGEKITKQVNVSSLYDITPTSYLRFDNSIFHDLSYQQARHINQPIQGVYVAAMGLALQRAGINRGNVITEVNGEKVTSLNDFMQFLNKTANGTKVHLRYIRQNKPDSSYYGLLEINRKWFEQSYCQQNTELGYWPCTDLPSPKNIDNGATQQSSVKTPLTSTKSLSAVAKIAASLVQVDFNSPYSIQGRSGNKSRYGTGVIVDAEKGLIVVERSLVFSMLGDVKIIFDNKIELEGKVEYIHPNHNLALISYPVNKVSHLKLSAIPLSDKALKRDDAVIQMGYNYDGEIEVRKTAVDTVQEQWSKEHFVPQFIERNMDVIHLVNPNNVIDGVLINSHNKVAALWANFEENDAQGKSISRFTAGLDVSYVKEIMALASGEKTLYSLEVGLTKISPVDALKQGVSEEWLNKLAAVSSDHNKLFTIYNVYANSDAVRVFKRGDILLAVNSQPVVSFKQVEQLSQQKNVQVTFYREGKVHNENVETSVLNGRDIDQVLFWAGIYLHTPHRAALQQSNISDKGLYIASYSYGSPASRYQIFAMQRIVEIDGAPIENAADFIKAVKNKQHAESVLIKTLDFNNKPKIQTLKLDNHYWPFYEVKYSDGKWQKISH